jgi:hypothetical protein
VVGSFNVGFGRTGYRAFGQLLIGLPLWPLGWDPSAESRFCSQQNKMTALPGKVMLCEIRSATVNLTYDEE